MMKQTFVVLAVAAIAFSAPQTKKPFHEHFEDFIELIIAEAGYEIEHLMVHYIEYEEFTNSLQYMVSNNFKELVYELESLPEFKAFVDFLENNNIDIHFFIDAFHEIFEGRLIKRIERHNTSGKDFTSYIADCIALFPKEDLAALFEEKMANFEEFRIAINSFLSQEWEQVSTALLNNETFQKEVEALKENGIDIHVVIREIKAIFGQD